MQIEMEFSTYKFDNDLKAFKKSMFRSARGTLNDLAMTGTKFQQSTIRQMFMTRNVWTEKSIFPRPGFKLGLVPHGVSNTAIMYSRTGTIQKYMERQEEGWNKKDPSIPSNKARTSGSKGKPVARRARLKTLQNGPKLKPSHFKRVRGRRNKIRAMLGMAQDKKKKLKFDIPLETEKDGLLPAGYWRVKKNSLVLIRRNQDSYKNRRNTNWHEKAIFRMNNSLANKIFIKNAAKYARFS